MNTAISYMYRDGSNYKRHGQHVVEGELTLEQIQPFLDGDGMDFIAHQVGLPALQLEWEDEHYTFPTDDDHVWSEITDIEPTEDEPTIAGLTAADILMRFQVIKGNWDVIEAMEHLGL